MALKKFSAIEVLMLLTTLNSNSELHKTTCLSLTLLCRGRLRDVAGRALSGWCARMMVWRVALGQSLEQHLSCNPKQYTYLQEVRGRSKLNMRCTLHAHHRTWKKCSEHTDIIDLGTPSHNTFQILAQHASLLAGEWTQFKLFFFFFIWRSALARIQAQNKPATKMLSINPKLHPHFQPYCPSGNCQAAPYSIRSLN